MTRIIAAVSLKGGSGKTSLVQNVGYEFSRMGTRVLMLDLDQQANLTIGCGVDPQTDKPPIYRALEAPERAPSLTVSVQDNLDLLGELYNKRVGVSVKSRRVVHRVIFISQTVCVAK